MASRTTPIGAFNSGDSVSATTTNEGPGGKIGRASVTANSSGTTTTETIVSVTVVPGSSREIDVRVLGNLRSSIAGGVSVRVTEDGTQIGRKNGYVQGSGQDWPFDFTFRTAPTGASHVYALITGVSGAAGNTVTLIASAPSGTDGEASISVYDQGPSF